MRSPPLYGGEYREGRETSLRGACSGFYRERRGVLTESVFGLLPRSQRRSYRERLCALGMFVFACSGRLTQRRLCGRLLRGLSYLGAGDLSGLTHEITIVRGQGREGVYAEDRSTRVPGVEIPSEYLLPRRDKYTRVYTTVYPRVHNSIHACTLPCSKYILCRARLYVCFLRIMPSIFSDGLRLPGI